MNTIALAILVGLAIFVVVSYISYEGIAQPTSAAGNNINSNNNNSSMKQAMNPAATSASNATTTNLTSINTFSAAGSISSLILPNVTMPAPMTAAVPSSNTTAMQTNTINTVTKGNASISSSNATSATRANSNNTVNATASTTTSGTSVLPPKTFILSGFWHLKVNNGKIGSFDVRFTKVHIDSTNRHTHEITNLTMMTDNNTSIKLNANGTTVINGTTGVALNNIVVWKDVKTTITITDASTIIISLDPKDTSNHFLGQSIYGVVDMVKDKDGKDIVHFPSIIHT